MYDLILISPHYGYDPDGFAIEHFKIVEGEPLPSRPSARGGKPLLLGKVAADDMDRRVGETLRLYESVYRIVGIYETGQPFEDGAALVEVWGHRFDFDVQTRRARLTGTPDKDVTFRSGGHRSDHRLGGGAPGEGGLQRHKCSKWKRGLSKNQEGTL